jgi:Ca2+-binding RTX toxin-like protein
MATPIKPTAGSNATIFGKGTTDDYLIGTAGDDIITGGVQAIAYSDDGLDTMQGGVGDDFYIVNNGVGSDIIIEYVNEGNDSVFSSVNFTLPAEVENIISASTAAAGAAGVILKGNAFGNILDASQADANDTLMGFEGSDTYIVGVATDKVVEGRSSGSATKYGDTGGTDTIISKAAANVDLSSLITDANQLDTVSGSTRTIASGTVAGAISVVGAAFIENVVLDALAGARNIIGNALNNRLTGNNANNTIEGGAGNDTLDGKGGTDILIGGNGNDIYIQATTGDTFTETSASGGSDTILSSVASGTVTAPNFIENITLTGTGNVNATGNTLANTLKGNSADNTLLGDAGNDTLYGLQGTDSLNGGTGTDKMYGGRGNDTYYVDNTGDVVFEVLAAGTGTNVGGYAITTDDDTVNGAADKVYSTVNYSLNSKDAQGVEEIELNTGAGGTLTTNINATGNAQNNKITGNNGGNILDGGAGVDELIGLAGNDTYVVNHTDDVVTEAASSGTDTVKSSATYTLPNNVENLTLLTGAGNGTGNTLNNIMIGNTTANTLTGNAGNDTISGLQGADTIDGGAGNDRIAGGVGRDVVTTGADNDTVVFASGNLDSPATASSVAGIDLYSDLVFADGANKDSIDLTVAVSKVGATVSGSVTEATFVTDMNTLLKSATADTGFKVAAASITAAIVQVNAGGLSGRDFLAIDLDKSGTFTTSDFVIEITGSALTGLGTANFV